MLAPITVCPKCLGITIPEEGSIACTNKDCNIALTGNDFAEVELALWQQYLFREIPTIGLLVLTLIWSIE